MIDRRDHRRPSTEHSPRLAGTLLWIALALCLGTAEARAEVYFAATEGYRCSQCHVNRTGGGMRTEFGALWAQTHLPYWTPEEKKEDAVTDLLRTGQAGPVRLGANLRTTHTSVFGSGDRDDTNEFDLSQGTVYLEASVFEDRVKLYVDEQFAPGGTRNREAFALVTLPLGRKSESGEAAGRWWIKAGNIFPPFGLRQLDDNTMTRTATGFSFTNSDEGVEFGFEPGDWQVAFSVTDGTQGAPENNDQKQFSLFSEYVRPRWRAGLSAMHNSGEVLDRDLIGLHGSYTVGKFVLLGEVDLIRNDFEESAGGEEVEQIAALVEGRFWFTRGQNLRLTWDVLDPDRDISTNTRERITLGYEAFLMPNLQVRANYHYRDAPPQQPDFRDDRLSLELHVFF